mgnify:FL=1
MSNIIKLDNFRLNNDDINNHKPNVELTALDVANLVNIRDGIEKLLNTAASVHKEPLGVSLAAGRYAAMKLYLMHGRAETMAFFDNCIQTVEIAEDIKAKE